MPRWAMILFKIRNEKYAIERCLSCPYENKSAFIAATTLSLADLFARHSSWQSLGLWIGPSVYVIRRGSKVIYVGFTGTTIQMRVKQHKRTEKIKHIVGNKSLWSDVVVDCFQYGTREEALMEESRMILELSPEFNQL